MKLIDIGANLAHDSFDEDRDDVIARAADAGVGRMILTGSSADSNQAAFELARNRPGVFWSTAGVHPHHAADYSDDIHTSILRLLEIGRAHV